MALMNGSGKVDRKFNAINVMKEFKWDFQQYQNRPLWFDTHYSLMLEAEEKVQEIKNQENGGHE